jgi:hypothetical protein
MQLSIRQHSPRSSNSLKDGLFETEVQPTTWVFLFLAVITELSFLFRLFHHHRHRLFLWQISHYFPFIIIIILSGVRLSLLVLRPLLAPDDR